MALSILGTVVGKADVTVSENLTLTSDLDWHCRGKLTIADGVTIDLAGHKFYVGELAGNGSITSTAAGDPAELHVVVPSLYTYGNATVGIHGNLRLVKEGYGVFAPTKTGNDYSGGTEIKAGLFKAWTCHYPALNSNGALKGSFVGPGAFFDFDGAAAQNRNGYLGPNNWYTLCGGTLCNRASDIGTGWSQVDHLRLTADSSLECRFSWGIIGGGYGVTDLDLAGHTLTVNISNNKWFYLWNTTVTAGTLKVGNGTGAMHIDKTAVRADNATLDLNAGLSVNANATFGTVIARMTGNSLSGGATLFIKNRFQPVSEFINNFQLKNGATLDLTERTAAYSLTSSLTKKTLGFENNATITVDVSGRVLDDDEQIVAWTAKPNATFVLDAASARAYDLVVTDASGLSVRRKASYVAAATWTGAGDVTNPADPANWSCTDANGSPLTAYPGPLTEITVGAAETMNIPVGANFHCKSITAAGALAADCDWRGIVRPSIVGTIDLKGHKLRLSDIRGNGRITDTSSGAPGELHVDVPAGQTAGNPELVIDGNVKLVKDGLGLFYPTRTGQTAYQGGTEVVAGTMKARNNRYSYNNVVVREGARFDLDPYSDGRTVWEFPAGPYNLDGGELYHNWQDITEGWGHTATINLTADSYYRSPFKGGLIAGGYNRTTLDLGGHTLDVDIGNYAQNGWKFFYLFNSVATKGTLRTGGFTGLYVNKATFNAPETTLDLGGLIEPVAAVVVSNVIVRTIYTGAYGAQNITIKGTFTPVSDWLHNFVMQNGTTLDLNRRWDPFQLTSPLTGKTLAFAANATVTVDVHERTLADGELIVAWNARPAGINFQLDAVTAARGKQLYINSQGIYLYNVNEVVDAQWTGAVDGDFAKSGNWICKDVNGTVIPEALPNANTFVRLPGALAIAQMKVDSFAHRYVMVETATLTTDTDWTDFRDTLWFDGVLDLAGHKLSMTTLNGNGTITDTSTGTPGELHIVVPENVVGGNSGVLLTGNLKLLKEGPGLYAPTKQGQTYTGGTEVVAGTMKAWTYHFPNLADMIIDAGATFDIDGYNQMGRSAANEGWYTLNGGTLINQTADITWVSLPRTQLTADSTIAVNCSFGILNNDFKEAFLKLNGHALTLAIAKNKTFSIYNCTMNAGTLKSVGEGALKIDQRGLQLPEVALDLGTSLYLSNGFKLKDLTVRYNGTAGSGATNWMVQVTGRYAPLTDYINYFKLLDGATLDLRTREGTWSTTSATTKQTLAIEDGAKLTLDLAGRTDLHTGFKVLNFGTNEYANVAFKLDPATAKRFAAVRKEDGVVLQSNAFLILIR